MQDKSEAPNTALAVLEEDSKPNPISIYVMKLIVDKLVALCEIEESDQIKVEEIGQKDKMSEINFFQRFINTFKSKE